MTTQMTKRQKAHRDALLSRSQRLLASARSISHHAKGKELEWISGFIAWLCENGKRYSDPLSKINAWVMKDWLTDPTTILHAKFDVICFFYSVVLCIHLPHENDHGGVPRDSLPPMEGDDHGPPPPSYNGAHRDEFGFGLAWIDKDKDDFDAERGSDLDDSARSHEDGWTYPDDES